MIHASHHFIKGAEAEASHVFTHLIREEEEEVDDVLGLPGKSRTQHRVLRGNADRAGVEMTFSHHDAAQRDQWRSGKAEFFRTQQSRNHHVTSGLQLAVGLHPNAAAQIVEQQNLLRLRESKFPRDPCVLDGTEWRCTGTPAIAADQHDVRVCLGNAGSNRTNAHLGVPALR